MEVGGQCHALVALSPGKRPGTHCVGCWVDPRAGMDGCEKSRLHRDSIPGPSSPYRVALPTELSRPFPLYSYKNIYLLGVFFCDSLPLLHNVAENRYLKHAPVYFGRTDQRHGAESFLRNWSSTSQEIHGILWNTQVHYCPYPEPHYSSPHSLILFQ